MFRRPPQKPNSKRPYGEDKSSAFSSGKLEKDLARLKEVMGESHLFVFRRYSQGLCLVYVSGLVNENIISRDILAHLPEIQRGVITSAQIPVGRLSITADINTAAGKVLKGYAALLRDGSPDIYVFDTRGVEKRSVQEPPTERTTRGSRMGFIEDIEVNVSLVRKTLNTPSLAVEYFAVGKLAVSKVAILYLKDIASPDIVKEVRHRLENIKTDDVLATGIIENHIEDHPWSLFPQAYGTEKLNKVVADLLEGRVAIMLAGTPYVLVVPALFVQFMQGVEDYFDRFWVGNFIRVLRFVALVLAITLTPTYIALVTYHHELIPFRLLLSIAESRREVPFSPIVEALLMEIIIEMLREAGLRLPTPLGQTMGVVGGVILGQAIVSANIVSPLIIIVVTVSAVASFVIPNYSAQLNIRLVKFPLMLLSAVFGAFGMSVGIILFLAHQASMESFGVPYMAPLAPTRYRDIGDSVVLSHVWQMKRRPVSLPHQKERRIDDSPQEHHKK